ncbi:MAG: hypothetical protein WAN26_07805 [Steroidobacteraceae bacterium]
MPAETSDLPSSMTADAHITTAERTHAQAHLSYASAQVQQYEDTAGLLVALGGGWWQDPAAQAW